MYILLVFLALRSVSTHDINVGSSTEGKKVFDEHFQASPAVWRQAQNVTINTTDDEVISRIVVTDLREDKDGDAKIVDGGEGQKKVTIELKSPTVLRGYDFKVEVYAALQKDYQNQKNGPVNPSEFKSNAGSLNTPNPGSKITPQSSVSQSISTNTESKQSKARETRDTEVKKLETSSPKIESPSIFGQKATEKSGNKDSNVPFTISNRQFIKDTEDDDQTTKIPSLKTNKDEVRYVRDTHEDDWTTKNLPKQGNFDSKTTTTTNKTPSYNLNRNNPVASYPVSVANEGRDGNPPSVLSQSNPTVYTPNFYGNYPSLVNSEGMNKDKPINDQSKYVNGQKRSARDTQAESKETNTPQITSRTGPAVANKRAENVTNDEERKTRSAQEGPKITPLNVDIKEVTSTTASTILTYQDDESSSKSPGVLTKTQNYPVPYPYEATTKAGSTTKSVFKRDTESQEPQTDKNVKPFGTFETTTKIASTTKSPVKRDTESSEEPKADDKNEKLNPKTFGSFEASTKISSTTKSPFKRDTESSEKPEADDKNVKFNPKTFGTFETSTKDSSTTKSPVKRDTESTEQAKADDKNGKLNPKSFGTFETTTKTSSTTKSPVKRDTESAGEVKADDKNVKLNPKSIGTFETSTKDPSTTKSPVKRDTESTGEVNADDKNVKLISKTFGTFETTTKISSTTKSPVKRGTESTGEVNADDKIVKLNPKSFGIIETTTKYSITTKSPYKRDTESSEESTVNDNNFKVIPTALGSQNATTHDHKVPVVSLQ